MARKALILALATFFGSGYVPFAPGTVASAIVCFMYYLWGIRSPFFYKIIVFAITMLISIPVAGEAEKIWNTKDDGRIVIDEVVGMFIPLFLASTSKEIFASFVLFRLFDIIKPFPIGLLEKKVGGGQGVVLDDVIAGLYAFLGLFILKQGVF